MVLSELVSYLFALGFWTREEGRNTLNGWLHALLPAVYSPPIDNLSVDDPKHLLSYEADSQELFRNLLTEVAATLMPIECDWLTVVKMVREQQPDYLVGKSRSVRLPVDGESRLCATLVLSVEKLLWPSDEAQNMLLELTMLIAPQK